MISNDDLPQTLPPWKDAQRLSDLTSMLSRWEHAAGPDVIVAVVCTAVAAAVRYPEWARQLAQHAPEGSEDDQDAIVAAFAVSDAVGDAERLMDMDDMFDRAQDRVMGGHPTDEDYRLVHAALLADRGIVPESEPVLHTSACTMLKESCSCRGLARAHLRVLERRARFAEEVLSDMRNAEAANGD